MAERSGFFPYVSGDANSEYDSAWLAGFVASFIGNGVYDGDLAVAAGSNMQIIIPSGRAWINGYHYRNDGNLALVIDNADGVLNRKDTVVLRWDINARSITAQMLKGTPASTATAPAIVRTAEQYDLKLAEISIPAGTTAITQALITDTRLDNSVCGIVTGVVKQIDTTKLYQQIQDDLAGFKATNEAGFSTWSDAQKTSFNTWLSGLKSALDGDTAGHLQSEIDAHITDTVAHMTQAQKDQLAAAIAHDANTNNPHNTTAAQVGLGNVDNTRDADKSVKYSATAGSAPANGGTASYAHYPSHAVGLADFGLRGNYISSASPSGGNDGDTWDQV